MENTYIPEEGVAEVYLEEACVDTTDAAPEIKAEDRVEEIWNNPEGGSLLGAGLTLELRTIKTAMIMAPCHRIPLSSEGMLLEHYNMPLAAELEVVLSADDRDIVRERFKLPTDRCQEILDAHRELAKMSPEFLTDSRLRDTAMSVYFPDLCDEYDFWYRISVDEQGVLWFALHIGPSNHQNIKKRIEGIIQL
jgi:hypothetical protein